MQNLQLLKQTVLDRRTGGLEINAAIKKKALSLDRRTGGLEKIRSQQQ